ncbi:hypothetical protein MLD38_035792 [Melastoma candidum]|uniref:Uncharacterized protein n=1 Tax=Melastoma candidum TaxID=119954 RepID=A0ACB9LI74_9MYRT|nr:hypothetical protein MLD38_035792 [Melastoma candidum]
MEEEDVDLQLDEMELVAAAAGYYYHALLTTSSPRYSFPNGLKFMSQVVDFSDDLFRDTFRMDKRVFHSLCATLRRHRSLRDTAGVMIEEQVAIFLNVIGHNERNRVVQERFRHSGETISRYFNLVLRAVKSLSREVLVPPHFSTPDEILRSRRFNPYFKDCIGAIGSMHIPAHVPTKDQSRFRDKKGHLMQNILAACTFDMQFIFVSPGWEGSADDSRVLRAVLTDPGQNFPPIPDGKYYLVNMGYSNTDQFVAPYVGTRYHVREFKGANRLPWNSKELFNHRHSSLGIAIRKSFEALKTRFPILRVAPQYAFHIQRDIVIAACVLHNYIKREEGDDWLFLRINELASEEFDYSDSQPDAQSDSPVQVDFASSRRESIAAAMWDDFAANAPLVAVITRGLELPLQANVLRILGAVQ